VSEERELQQDLEQVEQIAESEEPDVAKKAEGEAPFQEEEAPEEGGTEQETAAEEKKLSREEAKALKKKAKAEKKDKSKEKIEELEDRVKRQMAEFENFRKRTEREKAQMFETGARSVIEKILPVVDNFERGLQGVPGDATQDGFVEGMNMVYKQFMTELEAIGVKAIEAVGTPFNPDYHNAVMQVESEEYESGIVAQELQKGYMYRDTVVRHSMVAVVQ